jgi:hypothetical protein
MGIYWNICAACDRFMASWNQTVIDFARNGNFFFSIPDWCTTDQKGWKITRHCLVPESRSSRIPLVRTPPRPGSSHRRQRLSPDWASPFPNRVLVGLPPPPPYTRCRGLRPAGIPTPFSSLFAVLCETEFPNYFRLLGCFCWIRPCVGLLETKCEPSSRSLRRTSQLAYRA